jgi:hypothetical protein
VKVAPLFLFLSACFALPPSFSGKAVTPSGLFGLSAVEGTSALGTSFVRDRLRLRGEGLDGLIQAQIFDAAGVLVATLSILSKAATEAELQLDAAGAAAIEATSGVLTLRVSHQSLGFASRDITLLRGPAGPVGASGPPATVTGSQFISVTGNQIALKQDACSEGQVLKLVGGAWSCAADEVNAASAGVSSITAGNGVMVSNATGAVTASVVFGLTSNTVARGDHDHFGASFSGNTTAKALSVYNESTTVGAETCAIYGEAAVSQNGAFTRAAIRGSSYADTNGVGVIGDAQGPGAKGVAGIASGSDDAAGVFGYVNTASATAYGVWGTSESGLGVGVLAQHAQPDGVALRVQGVADFSAGATKLPLLFAANAASADVSALACTSGYVALSGGCYGSTALLTAATYNTSTGTCSAGSFSPGTGQHNAFCCRTSGSVAAEVVCLRAQ